MRETLKKAEIKNLDRLYGMGALSTYEWFEFKDRYAMPFNLSNRFYRTCLYPIFGPRSRHLDKFQLYYAFHCMLNGFKKALAGLKRTIEQREEAEVFSKKREAMVERFMTW